MKLGLYIYFIAAIISYIIGSIPNALIIGKVFFNKDIRKYGSFNLGGTNAMRELNTHTGIIIMVLDALKGFICCFLCYCILNKTHLILISGLFACIGHCYPIFADFKGGKAVATACGYVLAINIFITNNILTCFVIPMLVFALVLTITKYMSVASMSGVISASITSLIFDHNIVVSSYIVLLSIFIIIKHRSNIKNLINHKEHKITKKNAI